MSISPDQRTYVTKVLKGIGAEATPANVAFMDAWISIEGGKNGNFLNTTYTGKNVEGTSVNADGVKNYGRLDTSIQAEVSTLNSPRYAPIVNALKANQPWTAGINAQGAEMWDAYTGGASYQKTLFQRAATLDPASAPMFTQGAAEAAKTQLPYAPRSGGATRLQLAASAPTDANASQATPLKTVEATPIVPTLVDFTDLDNVPWWKVEGAIVGNPNLQKVDDAITFAIQLDQNALGNLKVRPDNNAPDLLIRLNVGVSSLSTGAAHQNSVQPTGSGLLLTLWDSKLDMISAQGTTGVFMNQFGLTALMSSRGSAEALGFGDLMQSVYDQSPKTLAAKTNAVNKFRVAAQDAFIELMALFKNNGLQRQIPMPKSEADNDLAWVQATGLTGYQMRARVGDVMKAGYVVMNYKGRILRGRFKSFEWSANAESPYRWDYSFTFRVMSEFSPYIKRVMA